MNTIDDPTTVGAAAAPAKKNPWFEFQARVRGLTHMSPPDAMRLCSALKAKKAYDEWADKEIVKFAFDWVKEAAGGAGETSAGLSAEEIARLEVRAAKFGGAVPASLEVLKKEKKSSAAAKKVADDPAAVVVEMPVKVVEAPAPAHVEAPKEKKAPRKKKDAPAPIPAPADTAAAMKVATEAQARADVAVAAYEEAMTKMAKANAAAESAVAAYNDAEIKMAEAKVCAQMAAEEVAAKMAEATSLRAAAAEAAVAAAKKAHLAAAAPLASTPSVIEHVEVAPVVAVAETPDRRGKKAKIPKHIKNLVWNKYIGADNATAKCVCCRQATISNTSFDCGHVIAEANGGDMNINNLRPICRDCNAGMGTRSMNDFTTEFFGWSV